MRYISGLFFAGIACVGTALLMAILLGQMVDNIEGPWQIIPAAGMWLILAAVAIAAFRYGMRQYDRHNR